MRKGAIVIVCAALFGGIMSSASQNDFDSTFEFEGKEYKQAIREKDVLATPEWDIEAGHECPLAVAKAIAAARGAFHKAFPGTEKWRVYTVSLSADFDKTHWYYDVAFESPEGDAAANVAVLLDGSVPKIER